MAKKRAYNRIKIVLIEEEKSSQWLVEKLKSNKSTVSKWCTNVNQPTIENLFRIAEVLGRPVPDLLNLKDPKKS